MAKYLGLDLGSTTVKGAVLDVETNELGPTQQRPFPERISGKSPTHFEIEPARVLEETRAVLEVLLVEVPTVSGILVCCQMGGLLLGDERARPISNYFSWRDERVLDRHPRQQGALLDALRQRTSDADLASVGNELRPGSAVSLLYWLHELEKLPRGASLAMTLGEYFVAQLGGAAPRSEPTLALGTQDLVTGCRPTDWLDRLGLSGIRWPEWTTALQPAGTLRYAGRDIPVYPAVGDQQAALLGAELQVGELSINISTGSQISLMTDSLQLGDYQTRPYFDGRFLNTITHLPAGRSLNGLIDLLTELAVAEGLAPRDPWSTIGSAVERTLHTDLDVNLAFFAGTVGDRGHIRNIQLSNLTVGSLFRAAFEHMADTYVACADRLSPNRSWRGIVFSGGLPQKVPILRQIVAQRFACPARFVAVAEETLAGLLQLAQRIEGSG
jgi:sugar (pentulose or hexulose) kinase